MSVWLAILITCTAPDRCEVSYASDQMALFPTEAECVEFATGMKIGAIIADGPRAHHTLAASCLELRGFVALPSDPA